MYKRILSLCLCLFLLTAMSPAAPVYGNGETGMPDYGENGAAAEDIGIKKEEDIKKEEEKVNTVYKLSLNNTLLKFDAKRGEQVRPMSFMLTNNGTNDAILSVTENSTDNAFSFEFPFYFSIPLDPGSSIQCSVSLNSNLEPGDYEATIYIFLIKIVPISPVLLN